MIILSKFDNKFLESVPLLIFLGGNNVRYF